MADATGAAKAPQPSSSAAMARPTTRKPGVASADAIGAAMPHTPAFPPMPTPRPSVATIEPVSYTHLTLPTICSV
eukprot:7784169-Prorocentrum_lima.AAC.1